jgi:hypothetical protein
MADPRAGEKRRSLAKAAWAVAIPAVLGLLEFRSLLAGRDWS